MPPAAACGSSTATRIASSRSSRSRCCAPLPEPSRPSVVGGASYPRPMGDDVHGGDAISVARALGVDPASILDLSASVNPLAPDVTALAAAHLESLTRYPDPVERADATALLAG